MVATGRPKTVNTNIGLMYPSDYGYAASSITCPKTEITLGDYNNDGCYNQNWLFMDASEWTISHNRSNSYHVWYVDYNGNVDYYGADLEFDVRPVLYLKSTIIVVSGDGTSENPYIIE